MLSLRNRVSDKFTFFEPPPNRKIIFKVSWCVSIIIISQNLIIAEVQIRQSECISCRYATGNILLRNAEVKIR